MAPIRLEQLFDVARGDSASGESPFASKFQPCRAIAAGEAQYAETRANALLGVFTSAEQSLDVATDGNPECGGLRPQPIRCAVCHGLVRRRHMFGHRGVRGGNEAACVAGNAFASE